jgi:hypothetical protein
MDFLDFFYKYIGFFIGFFVIMILAIIGYFADKNDSKKANSVDKLDDSSDASNVVDSSLSDKNVPEQVVSFNELPNANKKLGEVIEGFNDFSSAKFSSSDGDGSDDISKNFINDSSLSVSEVSSGNSFDNSITDNSVVSNSNNTFDQSSNSSLFDDNNFESVNMSLDDLEKKNFDSFLDKKGKIKDDDNFYYSDFDDSSSFVEKANGVSVDDVNSDINENVLSPNLNLSSEGISSHDSNFSDDYVQNFVDNASDSSSNVQNLVVDEVNSRNDVENSIDNVVSFDNDVQNLDVNLDNSSNDVQNITDNLDSTNSLNDIPVKSLDSNVDGDGSSNFVQSDFDDKQLFDHAFDNEISSLNVSSDAVQLSDSSSSSVDLSYDGVPELFNTGDQDNVESNDSSNYDETSTSFDIDSYSSDDDIWKF